mmetsp:Transcript_37369/g.55018  ORF Transcript_37369/g.55018 Transcript_37369/m.55018 type:complete len:650 (+) Transcript_37369:159-2108(+)|eukprot:CAMPEP_0195540182 /NCGR_PEP_ID=MMETSP0794_2-20130614/50441_1 /TAXON_ID=515487 /ORGANISM="Stephanopyxis turris, Strain CCMP 815" /LENGTH=649 /DNA_ID=CAMNT_0040674247 /DNA_START=159 /DNA_END=2108 /DNA_ORIENTATION=+
MRFKDSIVVHIPLHVTADLGVAMRRTRQKRLDKLRAWEIRHHIGNDELNGDDRLAPDKNKTSGNDVDDDDNDSSADVDGDEDDENEDKSNVNKSGKAEKKKKDGTIVESSTDLMPRRDQYSGVLDYLEAKYVKGVMIPDLDEKMRQKRALKRKKRQLKQQQEKKRKMQLDGEDLSKEDSDADINDFIKKKKTDERMEEDVSDLDDDDDDDDDDDSSSEDGARSCYSDDSFLDDTLLRTSVAEQVLASSEFGATKIEAEARKKKKKQKSADGMMMDYEDNEFFVNVGDLEMAPGYDDAVADATSIDYDALAKNSSSKKAKKSSKKKKKKPKDSPTPAASPPPPSGPKSPPHNKEEKKPVKKPPPKPETTPAVEPKPEPVTSSSYSARLSPNTEKMVSELARNAENAKKEQRRMYEIVLSEIHKMTEENLPRKVSGKGEMIKVSITIPAHKKPGESITFSNPRKPGQRLKVLIPANSTPGGKFVVSVPAPELTTPEHPEGNNFTRDAKDAFDAYSRAYDDWIDSEAKFRHHSPSTSNIPYKPNNERLKKFDEILEEFPSDLATPIDAAYLRKVVRRARQNTSKRKKSAAAMSAIYKAGRANESSEVQQNGTGSSVKQDDLRLPPKMIKLHVPAKSVHFPMVWYHGEDFTRS